MNTRATSVPTERRTTHTAHTVGTLLLCIGFVLMGVVIMRVTHSAVFAQVDKIDDYLVMDTSLPDLPLPKSREAHAEPAQSADHPAQGLPVVYTGTTPAMTPTPVPVPPIRLQIPALEMDWPVEKSRPVQVSNALGGYTWQWDVAVNGLSYLPLGSLPGAPGNVVITGHNNTQGQAFRYLPDVKTEDVIIVHTALSTFYYKVTEKVIVPYRQDPVAGDAELARYMDTFDDERLTLISCFPFFTNADRVVVVAKSVALGEIEGAP